jgi:hypothetical protein
MRRRANPLVRAVFARSLVAAAVVLGPRAASAAGECLEKPDLQINQAGHWYYYADRVLHRRCWFFETSGATVAPSPSPDRGPASNADSQPSWFSRFAAGLAQTLSSEPQPNSTLDNSSTITTPISPRHPRTNKSARPERSQIVPPPETNGVASAERHDQLLPQPTAEKDEKHPPQLTAADREALFEDFLKWSIDRNIFGRP